MRKHPIGVDTLREIILDVLLRRSKAVPFIYVGVDRSALAEALIKKIQKKKIRRGVDLAEVLSKEVHAFEYRRRRGL